MTLPERLFKPEDRRSQKSSCYPQSNMEGSIPEEWTKSIIVTIPKKGDLSQCSNYRTIALLSHEGKMLIMVLLERLKAQMKRHLSEEQAGFSGDRSTVHQPDPDSEVDRRESNTKGKALYQLLHWLPKDIWLDQTWCYLGNHQVIWSWNETDWNSAEYQWKSEVSSASWRRTGRMVQNHSRYTTMRSDIANNFHLVSWKNDGHNKREWNWNLSTWPQD